MSPASERHARVSELFQAAAELPPPDRAVFLETECGSDESLRREIEALLEADAQTFAFIEQPIAELPADLLEEEEEDNFAGRLFGAYRVIREIGRGGLGAVYLAARADEQFQKQVAIKVVKRGLDTDDILRRFRAERQILAQLEHPNIARLIDAGSTEEGLPYFVMEYVEGESITSYCDANKLSTTERLELFRLVCGALTYAHQHLVIHRDIKPSNILVTSDSESFRERGGVPKLLDFGIAKVLHAEDPLAALTMTGGRVMTPEYASPEQVRGLPVSTATDVYSLGVLLYELLSGAKPYRLTSHTSEELSRAITDQIPERPSTTAIRNQKSEINIEKSLRGDLDNIVLMALRKEPERRYSSVEHFSEDIRRHQEGLPVSARRDTFKYRAEKFIKRNKVGVGAAVVVVLSLLTGLAVAITQAHRATVQARMAREQRDAAERASARAERTSRFMQNILNYANPHWSEQGKSGTNITVREALDDLVARMDTELTDAPELRAELHYTVGEVHRTHGKEDVALRHFRQSLDLYSQFHGEQHPNVARGIFYVSLFAAKPEEAGLLLRSGIAIMRQTDPGNINLPYMLEDLAFRIMSAEGENGNESRLAEAERLLQEAKLLFIPHYGESHSTVMTADSSLVTLARLRGDSARAESIRKENSERFRQAESKREEDVRRFGKTDEGGYYHIWALYHLAEAKLALGNVTEAETLFGQTLQLGRAQWDADDSRFTLLVRYISLARASAIR